MATSPTPSTDPSKATITPSIPLERITEILKTAETFANDARSRLLIDATDPRGSLTTYTSGIHLDLLKAALGPGHAVRQIVDCCLIDELTTRLRSEKVKTTVTKEEDAAVVKRAEASRRIEGGGTDGR